MIRDDRLLLTFYGDDFTGSTDVMEVLALAGLRTVLFLSPPSPDELARYPGIHAAGVAGISRSLTPDEMRCELKPIFKSLKELNAPIMHYKICSTFDSSPEIGSIGCAINLGLETFESKAALLLVGAPALGRYQVFGNLFARSGGESGVYRLDRHPSMLNHPVTPMQESDLLVHLQKQTKRKIGLLDIRVFDKCAAEVAHELNKLISEGAEIVLIDILSDSHMPIIGKLFSDRSDPATPLFIPGSSGVEYALTVYWRQSGLISAAPPRPTFTATDKILVVSGSCSPVTKRQIEAAEMKGFLSIPLDFETLHIEDQNCPKRDLCILQVKNALDRGRSVILHTALGPDDLRILKTDQVLKQKFGNSLNRGASGRIIGTALGHLMKDILSSVNVSRAVVTGGDTSGYVARSFGIHALEMIAPVAPGSPLCRVYSQNKNIQGMEILFKGGQVGNNDLFETIRRGTE